MEAPKVSPAPLPPTARPPAPPAPRHAPPDLLERPIREERNKGLLREQEEVGFAGQGDYHYVDVEWLASRGKKAPVSKR